jgi:two-component system sensor histidine kinase YesM
MSIGMENIKKYLNELNLLSLSWYYDTDMMEYLRQDKSNTAQDIYVDRQITSLYSQRPEISLVHLYAGGSDQQYYQIHYSLFTAPWQSALPSRKHEEWQALPSFELLNIGNGRFLTIHKKLLDYPRPTWYGLLSIYVSLAELERLNNQMVDLKNETAFMFFGPNKQLLYTSGKMENSSLKSIESIQSGISGIGVKQGYWSGEWMGQAGVFIFINDQYLQNSLTVVKFIPLASINKGAQQTLNTSIAVQFAALAAIIVFTFLLAFSTSAPIKRLIRNMARVESG